MRNTEAARPQLSLGCEKPAGAPGATCCCRPHRPLGAAAPRFGCQPPLTVTFLEGGPAWRQGPDHAPTGLSYPRGEVGRGAALTATAVLGVPEHPRGLGAQAAPPLHHGSASPPAPPAPLQPPGPFASWGRARLRPAHQPPGLSRPSIPSKSGSAGKSPCSPHRTAPLDSGGSSGATPQRGAAASSSPHRAPPPRRGSRGSSSPGATTY